MTETAPLEPLRARLNDGRAGVGVAGLGSVGLPLAVELTRRGLRITGIDPDTERVRAVSRGESHVEALPPRAGAELVKAGHLQTYPDLFVPRLQLGARELASVAREPDVVAGADAVMIHTDHTTIDDEWVVAHARLVFDTRNATRNVRVDRTRVVRL